MSQTAALPIASLTLRILLVANWVLGGLLLALLLLTFQQPGWTWHALGVADIAARPGGSAGLRAIVAAGVIGVPLAAAVLAALAQLVASVRRGDPFSPANASRLRKIAWVLLALQGLHIAVAAIAASVSTDRTPLRLGGGGTLTGWLAVLLLFVLAGVFAEGAAMRADLDGTV